MTWRVFTTSMGLNDARCVVWAIGEFFFYIFVFFIYLTNFLVYIQAINYEIHDMEGVYDEYGPKRRKTRRLGHR